MGRKHIQTAFVAVIGALFLAGCGEDFSDAVKKSLDGYGSGYEAYVVPRSDHGIGWAYFADSTISQDLCASTLPPEIPATPGNVYFPSLDIASGLDAEATVNLTQGFVTNAPAATAWVGASGISEVKLTLMDVKQYLLPPGYNYSPYKVSPSCRSQIADYMQHHPGQPVYIIVAAFAAQGIDFTFTRGSGAAGGTNNAPQGAGSSPLANQQCAGNGGYATVGAGASVDFSKVGQLSANLCYVYKADNVLSVRAANGDNLWIAYHYDTVTDISQIQ